MPRGNAGIPAPLMWFEPLPVPGWGPVTFLVGFSTSPLESSLGGAVAAARPVGLGVPGSSPFPHGINPCSRMPAAPGPGCQPCVLGEKGTLQRWGSPGVPPLAAGFPPPAAGTSWFLLHSSFSEQLPAGQAPPAWHWLCQSWGELRPAGTGFHWVSALQPCPASSAQADAQGLELAALGRSRGRALGWL